MMLPDNIKDLFHDYDMADITQEQFYTLLSIHFKSQHDGKPIVSGSVVPDSAGLIVSAEWCPKCSPNTWGNQIAQVYPEVQICAKCGYEHRRNIAGTTDR